jgi:quercetin 2,3-dioxygenase
MANYVFHKSNTRGFASHGWLETHHTFSFADYFDPKRMHFGALRVLNDDVIVGGMGFGTHPHDNMEIVTIPLEGDLKHRDSMGNESVIHHGDVQVMSAGTGVYHSEFNNNADRPVKLLQIWVIPNQQEVKPRYGQISLNVADRHNRFQQILSPNADDAGVWIYQKAWFHLASLDKGFSLDYQLKSAENGLYAFIIEGELSANGHILCARDGMGVWETNSVNFLANSKCELLLIEVPMLQ